MPLKFQVNKQKSPLKIFWLIAGIIALITSIAVLIPSIGTKVFKINFYYYLFILCSLSLFGIAMIVITISKYIKWLHSMEYDSPAQAKVK